jgi:hypothetical protein
VEDRPTPDEERTGREMPEDEPQAVEEHGTTAEEQREGETLDERLAREEEEKDQGGPRLREAAGTLAEEGSGLTDAEKDEVGEQAEAVEGLTAEEEALRVEPEAPGGTDRPDSYVEEDR